MSVFDPLSYSALVGAMIVVYRRRFRRSMEELHHPTSSSVSHIDEGSSSSYILVGFADRCRIFVILHRRRFRTSMNGRHHRLSLSVSQFDGGRVILWIRVFGVEHDATGCDEQFYPVLLSTCPIVCQMGRSESSKPVWMAVYIRLSEWYDIRNCIVDVVCPCMSVSLMVVR